MVSKRRHLKKLCLWDIKHLRKQHSCSIMTFKWKINDMNLFRNLMKKNNFRCSVFSLKKMYKHFDENRYKRNWFIIQSYLFSKAFITSAMKLIIFWCFMQLKNCFNKKKIPINSLLSGTVFFTDDLLTISVFTIKLWSYG